MTDNIQLPQVERMQAMEVRPGDTVVLTLPASTTPEQFDLFHRRIKEMWEHENPGVKLLVLAGGIEVSVLREADGS